jgi:hypothetical protein
VHKRKRSILTSDRVIIDATFDHAEETLHIYCNYPHESEECQRIWFNGAEDTIIRLPDHVGEGPYARIVSIAPASPDFQISKHHLESRSLTQNTNPIYELKIDYNFHLIKRQDQPINMRIDYTNLLGYWDKLTNTPADSKRKRSVYGEHITKDEWHDRIEQAKETHGKLRKRQTIQKRTMTTEMELQDKRLVKRWWGTFLNWLGRLVSFCIFLSNLMLLFTDFPNSRSWKELIVF